MTGPSTLPTDAERAQARAEHLAAVADCFELVGAGDERLIRAAWDGALSGLITQADDGDPVVSIDEARAIRDRLAELIDEAETGGAV